MNDAVALLEERVSKLEKEVERLHAAHGSLLSLVGQENGDRFPPRKPGDRASFEEILQGVCRIYGISASELLGPKIKRRLGEPRKLCMWLCTKLTSLTLTEIASSFRRTHTRVIMARDWVEKQINEGSPLAMVARRAEKGILKVA